MTPEVRSALKAIDKQFDAVRAMPEPIPKNERYRSGIEDVKKGGYIRVAGEVYCVLEVSVYKEKKSSWYELDLFGLYSGQSLNVEWEKDDEVEVTLNAPALSLRDIGYSADAIEAMSDEEKGTIRYDGRSYHYDDDYKAKFFRGGDGKGEKVYFYDFETDDERYCLSVEEWGDKESGYEYEVFVGEYIDPESIEVLVVGDGS
jgi:hypothetical protein